MNNRLKLLWLEPKVLFNGKGIATAWGEEMEKKSWLIERDETKWEDCDLIFFSSDSQLRPELIGKKPTILFFWGWPPMRLLNKRYHEAFTIAIRLMAQCDRILAPSICVMEQLADFGLPSQLCVPGVDAATLDSVVETPSKKPQIIFISRLEPYKNLDALMYAVSVLRPMIDLVVFGPGDTSPYVEQVKKLNLSVTFAEPDDREKVMEIKRSRVLVHPSMYEGFGLPPLEALYLGTPVIALDTPHMRWILKDDAYYAETADGIAQAIGHIFNDPEEVKERTLLGQQRVKGSLTLSYACDRLWVHIHQTIKDFLAKELRRSPQEWAKIYDFEHKRNWAYGNPQSPEWAAGPMRFDPTWERHWRAQAFTDALKECKAKIILDVGSGAVYPTIFARAGFHVTALDISQEAIRQVKEIAQKWGVLDKIEVKVGDAVALPWEDGCFDAVVQGEIWEHIPDVEKAISEGLRVLKPGGYLVASTPIGSSHYDPMHLRAFDDNSISALVKNFEGVAKIKRLDKIAESEGEPSCYFIVMEKRI